MTLRPITTLHFHGFDPADPHLFFTRNDAQDPRLGDLVQPLEGALPLQSNDYCIGGYPDDEGVRINGGRAGAAAGPDAIRTQFYKMTPYLTTPPASRFSKRLHRAVPIRLIDAGNLNVEARPLAERHAAAKRAGLTALQNGARWIALGGGHDYAYADGAAFLEFCRSRKQRGVIINFDAHLDVRSPEHGLNSGTPFYRLLDDYQGFDLIEVGVQAQCNSAEHYAWVTAQGAKVLTWDDLRSHPRGVADKISRFLAPWLKRRAPAYLSVDIDGFSSAYAGGCSQAFPTGFAPDDFFRVLQPLCAKLDVVALGIYEVAPPLDQDLRTARLASQIVHYYIHHPSTSAGKTHARRR